MRSPGGDCRTWRQDSLFETLGYSGFKVVPANDVVAHVSPNPAREGRHAEQQFEHGASGLFGEELPGLWLSKKKEALKLYRKISSAMNCMTTTVFLHGRMVRAVFFRGHQLDEESFPT
jgi:hypothetical protein